MKPLMIESEWHELSRQKFAGIAEVLFDYSGNSISSARLKIIEVLTGIEVNPELKRAGCTQDHARLTSFVFQANCDPDIKAVLSPELQKTLSWCLPEEITDKSFIGELQPVINLLKAQADFNLSFGKNLLPEIYIDRVIYQGPVFNVDNNGVLETDIRANEFLDAFEFYNAFCQTNDIKYLAQVAACFYRTSRTDYYDLTLAQCQARLFETITPKYLKAVWLMFLYYQQYFYTHPVFSLLFSKRTEPNHTEKISLGSGETIFTLSKEGYGTITELSKLRIDEFFALQLKRLKDQIDTLRSHEMKDVKIAEALKLPLTTIKSL